jgi:drug/metabolite transporter (DMT)-like permease
MKKEHLSVPFKLFIAFLLLIYSVLGLLVTMFFLWGATSVKQNNDVFGLISMVSFAATITMWVFYFKAVNNNNKKTMILAGLLPAIPVVMLIVYMFVESN